MEFLDSNQQTVVNHEDGPILVIAGPGSGRTLLLTRRLNKLFDTKYNEHFRVLVLTSTSLDREQLKERLNREMDDNLRVKVETLSGFCLDILTDYGETIGLMGKPNLLERYECEKVLFYAIRQDFELNQHILSPANNTAREWLDKIFTFKRNLILPEMVEDSLDRKVYEAYNNALHLSNSIDFEDLVFLSYRLVMERPQIADLYNKIYRYMCILDAQELTEGSYQLIKALNNGPYKNVMMVGDPNQSIYGWLGANPSILNRFVKEYKAKKVKLLSNYRSSKSILNIAKILIPDFDAEGVYPLSGGVDVIIAEDEQDEAKRVVDYLERLVEGEHPEIQSLTLDKCAVLGRTSSSLLPIKRELEERNISHSLNMSQNESSLFEDFELCLRAWATPGYSVYQRSILKRWNLDTNAKMTSHFFNYLKKVVNEKYQKAILDAIDQIDIGNKTFDLKPALDFLGETTINIIQDDEKDKLVNDFKLWKEHWNNYINENRKSNNPIKFINYINHSSSKVLNQGLSLLTIHKSKGLEFDVVFLVGLSESPYNRAKQYEDEERRLMFVAVTRAKQFICFSYPKTKVRANGRRINLKPSMLLTEIIDNSSQLKRYKSLE